MYHEFKNWMHGHHIHVIEYTLFAKLMKVNLYYMSEIHENTTVLLSDFH